MIYNWNQIVQYLNMVDVLINIYKIINTLSVVNLEKWTQDVLEWVWWCLPSSFRKDSEFTIASFHFGPKIEDQTLTSIL